MFTMLADDHAVEGATFGAEGILAWLPPGGTRLVEHDQRGPVRAPDGRAHADAGQHYVAAPVFGRPEASGGRKAFRHRGGCSRALEPVLPLLGAIGQRTFVVSEDPSAANLVKLSGNFLIASVIESLGEAVALVAKAGVDRQQYVDILTSTLFTAPAYQTYGGLIARQEYEASRVRGDARPQGRPVGAPRQKTCRCHFPSRACCMTACSRLVATGNGHLDWSAVATLSDRDAGGASNHPA